MKEIFFTGGSGLLALNWTLSCKKEWKVTLGTFKREIFPSFADTISLSKAQSASEIEDILVKISPDIVVNTAAVTNIEYCELNPFEAYQSNVVFASNVATACNRLGITLVHISTDHLFSGFTSNVTEEEEPSPLNVYAKTKAESEKRVAAECEESIIVRTNFFGLGTTYRLSLTDQIIKEVKNGYTFYGFEDVFFTPILASDLANCIFELIDQKFRGVINITSNYRISKFEFAVLVAKIFELPKPLIKSTRIRDRSGLVIRPNDMSLSNKKVSSMLRRDLGTAEDGLRRLLQQTNSNTFRELQTL